jgi:RNA polymerase sigma-70 factor (ECF subfamily)
MQELALEPLNRMAEGELARQADKAAREREFETHLAACGPLAFRVARGVLRNTADAEEVAQEALLRAYRRFDRLRDPGQFRGWLARISFRLALDRLKSARRRELRETRWSEELPPAADAEQLASSSEFREKLEQAVDELPGRLRAVLLLAAMQGHSLEEVAAMLEIPCGTVKSRLFLARKKLAEKLRCLVSTSRAS